MTDDDVIHVSPWLVKTISAGILAGLGSIAIYMVAWAVSDASYKSDLLVRIKGMEDDILDIKRSTAIIPYNTQKIITLERDVDKLERQVNGNKRNGN